MRNIPRQASVARRRFLQQTSIALAVSAALSMNVSAQDIDLAMLGERGFVVSGVAEGERLGASVSGAGDINGDGYSDLVMTAARGMEPNDGFAVTYVIFGKPDSNAVTPANAAAAGFSIARLTAGSFPSGISGTGDVNGDGLMDVIVGTRNASPNNREASGAAYVVFGKREDASVDLGDLGDGGFSIAGARAGDRFGAFVSGAGDVNGDGLADLVVSTYPTFVDGVRAEGSSYVVFGKSSPDSVDLASLGSGGFRMSTGLNDDRSIFVSGAGDVNGDGLADVIVGANYAAPGGVNRAGQSYVVFGSGATGDVDLLSLGDRGFVITGNDLADGSGGSVAGAGDVNGDGLADVLVGARLADPDGTVTGAAYIVFGKRDTNAVELGALGDGGFILAGANELDNAGWAVAGAGDVNGDGKSDVLVGAPGADGDGTNVGQAYLVAGRADPFTVDLGALGLDGLTLFGDADGDEVGRPLSGAGDVNGDGLSDLIIGASKADPNGVEDAGIGYVVFSQNTPLTQSEYRGYARNQNAPRLALGVTGDGSNDSTPDSRLWIDFDDGATPGEQVSLVDVTLIRNAGSFDGAAAPLSWRVESDREGWSEANVSFRYVESELLGADEVDLRIFHSAAETGPFSELHTVVDTAKNILTVRADQLGTFAIGALAPGDVIFRDGFEAR